ncbi:hypothetical protein EB796_021569 [Bugula neritina]|uniref:GP-PDE domain-containing protein n=1 Tax=Bugula neritina TaxID=10212 RepID=A0A7J7J2U2_BUGNE|nr:hypothetical protein EB796_021569 [Bugula neritina]
MWFAVTLVLGCYCTLSYVLRLKPEILHKPRRRKLAQDKRALCLHVSHRGGAGENLENTMKAFDYAAALGTDMFEIDCQMTKDNYVVIAHDNNLLRLCGEDVLISETNFYDLPPLLCTQQLAFMKGHHLTKQVPENERKILLLEDLFKKYPAMLINIDIKTHNLKLISSVAELVKKYQREDRTLWGNSSSAIMTSVRALNTNILLYYSGVEVIKTLFLYCTGLLPFVPVYADCFEIPMFEIGLKYIDVVPIYSKWRPYVNLLLRVLDYFFTNEKLITHLRKRGVPTIMFVLNTEEQWERAAKCGAMGIMTDFPSQLKLWMSKNGYTPFTM